MNKYESLDKVISNKNIIKVLESAKLSGEGNLLVEVLEDDSEEETYKIYVEPKNYNFNKDNLVYLGIVNMKMKERIKNWYVELKGQWKAE